MKYIEFINDEQSYLNWLRVNSEGFVVNTPKSKPLNNRVLHTAACSHVTKLRGNAKIGGFTERNYIKICSLSVYQLRDWTKLEGMKCGSFDKECPHCRPWLQHSYTSIEQGLEVALLLKPNYKDLTSRHAVIKAIDEFNSLGRKEFLSKYGFGKARQFFLVYEGEQYDSKAIFGAAYGYQFSRPLQSDEFSGGNDTVRPILEKLNFTVIANSVDDTISLAEETTDKMWEGAKRTITVNSYERSNKARLACIEHHGSKCKVCSIYFGEVYGNEFHGFIHVHHLTPVSEVNSRYEVDPKKDLIPLCPNCHAVIHYGGKTRTVKEVQQKIRKYSDFF